MNALLLFVALLTATPAVKGQANTILVMTDGRKMLVQSFEFAGHMIKIVGPKGEPLSMRAELVDIEKTKAATEQNAAKLATKAAGDGAAAAAAARMAARREPTKTSILEASEQALARGTTGGFSAAGESGSVVPSGPIRSEETDTAVSSQASVGSGSGHGSIDPDISARCAKEWPEDGRMRRYCEEQQQKAARTLTGSNASSVIRSKCQHDWPGDYRMQAYCEEQQVEASNKMDNMPRTVADREIREACRREWPNDARMQAYCEDRAGYKAH